MATKFELDRFAIEPTQEQFDACRKDDLLLIANFFDIAVPRGALKRDVKKVLYTELVKQKILPGESAVSGDEADLERSEGSETGEAELKSEDAVEPVCPTQPQEQLLAIRLKELEVELSQQNYQSQLLHVRTLELESHRDIRIKELELQLLQAQSAANTPGDHIPVLVPAATSSPHRLSETLCVVSVLSRRNLIALAFRLDILPSAALKRTSGSRPREQAGLLIAVVCLVTILLFSKDFDSLTP
ncbi:uncharacterized protein [Misgurnus anguillicaudatus]|uniref:uncharacterized protein n=1 Tax=Misgurnus anguillicaudatus TaxID=75329 RepID=UPI003CCF1B83